MYNYTVCWQSQIFIEIFDPQKYHYVNSPAYQATLNKLILFNNHKPAVISELIFQIGIVYIEISFLFQNETREALKTDGSEQDPVSYNEILLICSLCFNLTIPISRLVPEIELVIDKLLCRRNFWTNRRR